MTKLLKKLAADRSGATAIEYGLIAAFIALAMVAGMTGLNTQVKQKFTDVTTAMTTSN